MAKRPTTTLTLTARQRRELAQTLRDARALMDDPLALMRRAAALLNRSPEAPGAS